MATETKIEIVPVNDSELYCRYPGQTQAQPCYLWLDCDEAKMGCEYNPEPGNAVPARVWHHRTRRYPIQCLTDVSATSLLHEALPLAERIVAGYGLEWDGHNHVGRLDDDAAAAHWELTRLCERYEGDTIDAMDAGDWFSGLGSRDAQREHMGILGDTTDDRLEQIAVDQADQAWQDWVVIDGLADHLTMLRDEARQQ